MTAYSPVLRKCSADEEPRVPAEKLSRNRTLYNEHCQYHHGGLGVEGRLQLNVRTHTLCSRGTVVPPL